MSTGELERRVREMEARGYRVHFRGVSGAVLVREPQAARIWVHPIGAAVGLAILVFGLWRGSWLFGAVGLLIVVAVGADRWLSRRGMAVQLTLQSDGRVKEQLIKFGGAE